MKELNKILWLTKGHKESSSELEIESKNLYFDSLDLKTNKLYYRERKSRETKLVWHSWVRNLRQPKLIGSCHGLWKPRWQVRQRCCLPSKSWWPSVGSADHCCKISVQSRMGLWTPRGPQKRSYPSSEPPRSQHSDPDVKGRQALSISWTRAIREVPTEYSGGWWKMRDSFVKEVTFEQCLEGWGSFPRQQGLGDGLCRPQGRAIMKSLGGGKV